MSTHHLPTHHRPAGQLTQSAQNLKTLFKGTEHVYSEEQIDDILRLKFGAVVTSQPRTA